MCYYEGDFTTFNLPFPICNHVQGVRSNNIGYVQGVLGDRIPFEAEMWKDGKTKTVAFFMPYVATGFEEIKVPEDRKSKGTKGNVVGFCSKKGFRDWAVLPIGMVEDGEEENFDLILYYAELLVDAELITFTTEVNNAYVAYYIDVAGNDLVGIYITVEDETGQLAYCPLRFRKFIEK